MTFQIEILPPARKQLAKLDRQVRERVRHAIDGLAENPRPPGFKPLVGRPGYRIKVGKDYRVIYLVQDAVLWVLVLEVGHRSSVYR